MILPDFSSVNVLIIGDVMLDRYHFGKVSRVSPEAPVPVVQLQKTTLAVGGAANVAANVVGLGANVVLVGIAGTDSEAGELTATLHERNIDFDHIVHLPNRTTTVKTRVIAQNHHIVRIDQETTRKLDSIEEAKIWTRIEPIIADSSIVIISDYAKGLLTDSLLSSVIAKCKETHKLVIVDPKGKDFSKYRGANLLTPNRKEAFEAFQGECDELEMVGDSLMQANGFESLLVTEGEDGMTLFQRNAEIAKFSSEAREVYDVTGAGDTVIATLGVALGFGMNLTDSVRLANIAAGLVVENVGTTAIDLESLRNVS